MVPSFSKVFSMLVHGSLVCKAFKKVGHASTLFFNAWQWWVGGMVFDDGAVTQRFLMVGRAFHLFLKLFLMVCGGLLPLRFQLLFDDGACFAFVFNCF